MQETLAVEPIALVKGPEGEIYIGGTRVPLHTIVRAYENGATPEEIAQQFPSLSLGVAYEVIGYYLRHVPMVESYLAERAERHDAVRGLNESRWPQGGIRERLLARRNT